MVIYNNKYYFSLLPIWLMKEFCESINIWRNYEHVKVRGLLFVDQHPAESTAAVNSAHIEAAKKHHRSSHSRDTVLRRIIQIAFGIVTSSTQPVSEYRLNLHLNLIQTITICWRQLTLTSSHQCNSTHVAVCLDFVVWQIVRRGDI